MQILPDHSLLISLCLDDFASSSLIEFAHIDQSYLPLKQPEPSLVARLVKTYTGLHI